MSPEVITEEQLLRTFGKGRDELVRLADEHTMTVQAWLASRSPMAEQVDGIGMHISSTGLQVPLLNLALGCNFPQNANEKEIDGGIRAVLAYFKERDVPWLWWIGPNPSPADVDGLLKRNGILVEASKLPAMVAPIGAKLPRTDTNPAIKVWRARGTEDLQAASRIRHEAFRFPEESAPHYFDDMGPDWLEESSPARLFMAGYHLDDPAAIGAVIVGAGLPGIYVMATLPSYMRHGFGKAILEALIKFVKSEHTEKGMMVLTASRYGFPLYAQYGFIHLYDYTILRP